MGNRILGGIPRPQKISLLTVALATTLLASSSASAANPTCPTCFVATSAAAPVASSANSLGINVAAVLKSSGWGSQPTSPLQFTSPEAGPVANWNGTGELPGAFQRPWELAPNTNFDPSFRSSFWTPETGPIETPWAPWNWSRQTWI
ncbi:MAG: hypothetical protein A2X94_17150 [Bdellovibrionales bacterium GWB1_55_8]|nr:MAG: hypothetical protein A2X94_17150 [Bdellovibrionales bacterium GWB1_55_8]